MSETEQELRLDGLKLAVWLSGGISAGEVGRRTPEQLLKAIHRRNKKTKETAVAGGKNEEQKTRQEETTAATKKPASAWINWLFGKTPTLEVRASSAIYSKVDADALQQTKLALSLTKKRRATSAQRSKNSPPHDVVANGAGSASATVITPQTKEIAAVQEELKQPGAEPSSMNEETEVANNDSPTEGPPAVKPDVVMPELGAQIDAPDLGPAATGETTEQSKKNPDSAPVSEEDKEKDKEDDTGAKDSVLPEDNKNDGVVLDLAENGIMKVKRERSKCRSSTLKPKSQSRSGVTKGEQIKEAMAVINSANASRTASQQRTTISHVQAEGGTDVKEDELRSVLEKLLELSAQTPEQLSKIGITVVSAQNPTVEVSSPRTGAVLSIHSTSSPRSSSETKELTPQKILLSDFRPPSRYSLSAGPPRPHKSPPRNRLQAQPSHASNANPSNLKPHASRSTSHQISVPLAAFDAHSLNEILRSLSRDCFVRPAELRLPPSRQTSRSSINYASGASLPIANKTVYEDLGSHLRSPMPGAFVNDDYDDAVSRFHSPSPLAAHGHQSDQNEIHLSSRIPLPASRPGSVIPSFSYQSSSHTYLSGSRLRSKTPRSQARRPLSSSHNSMLKTSPTCLALPFSRDTSRGTSLSTGNPEESKQRSGGSQGILDASEPQKILLPNSHSASLSARNVQLPVSQSKYRSASQNQEAAGLPSAEPSKQIAMRLAYQSRSSPSPVPGFFPDENFDQEVAVCTSSQPPAVISPRHVSSDGTPSVSRGRRSCRPPEHGLNDLYVGLATIEGARGSLFPDCLARPISQLGPQVPQGAWWNMEMPITPRADGKSGERNGYPAALSVTQQRYLNNNTAWERQQRWDAEVWNTAHGQDGRDWRARAEAFGRGDLGPALWGG